MTLGYGWEGWTDLEYLPYSSILSTTVILTCHYLPTVSITEKRFLTHSTLPNTVIEFVANVNAKTNKLIAVENLAHKRKAWTNAKSRRRLKGRPFGKPARAVDGVLDTSLPRCAVLDNLYIDNPYIVIDLGRKNAVHGVIITTWQGIDQGIVSTGEIYKTFKRSNSLT